MSYILDALRKAERERNLGRTPTLESQAVEVEKRTGLPGWLWALGGAVVAIGVSALLFQWGGKPQSSRASEAPHPLVSTTPPNELPTTAPPSQTLAPVEPADLQTVVVNTPDGPMQATLPKVSEPLPPIEPEVNTASEPEPEIEPVAGAVTGAVTGPVHSDPPKSSNPVEKSKAYELPAGEPPIEAAALENDPVTIQPRQRLDIPSYEGLPQAVRSGIPALTMNAHIYSSRPGKGFIMINGKKYREGDVLVEGPEVAEILPEGAVLHYRNTDFLLPVPR